MKSKKLTRIIFYMIIGIVLLLPTRSKAVLQANGGTPATKLVNNWLLEIRQMQGAGGALGLTDTINTTNLTSENKNLDIHMEKNTEYGAMAILSASSYGKQDKVNDGETTTGNATGIKININNEMTSAGYIELGNRIVNFKNALGRYKDTYTTVGGKVGDAIDIGTWHGGSDCYWLSGKDAAILIRSRKGSLFSYYGRITIIQALDGDASADRKKWATRAVVVCGSGV